MPTASPLIRPTRIQALSRANALLEVIGEHGADGARLVDLCAATGLNKTTVYNLVAALVELGFAAQRLATKRYVLGPRNFELGRRVSWNSDLSALCADSLMRLCRDTRETVNLAIPFRGHAIITDSLEGSYGVRVTSYAGTPAPYHATACGKAILAFSDDGLRERALWRGPLAACTERTITDPAQIELRLKNIRRRGYAIDLEENEIGANCVAVPILGASGTACGALSIAGPKVRMTRPVMDEMAARVIAEIRQVEAALHRSGDTWPAARPGRSRSDRETAAAALATNRGG